MKKLQNHIRFSKAIAVMLCCYVICAFFIVSCTKKDDKPKYTVNLPKINNSDTLTETMPWITWSVCPQPPAGSYAELCMAAIEPGEQAAVVIETHATRMKMLDCCYGGTQGYPMLGPPYHYAFRVNIYTPGSTVPISSEVREVSTAASGLPFVNDILAANQFQYVNIYKDTGNHITIDMSWIEMANDMHPVNIQIKEVEGCPSIFCTDPTYVNGHWEVNGQPACQWELEKNRQGAFNDNSIPLVYNSAPNNPEVFAATASKGNKVVTTKVVADPNKCYLVQLTDPATGHKNTVFVGGLR